MEVIRDKFMLIARQFSDHPIAGIFPLLAEPELKALSESIAENGLKVPITLFEGKILDGRNRYRACLEAGVEPRFAEYSGDSPATDVVAWNLERRHLNATQRAAVALESEPLFAEEARKRQATSTGGISPQLSAISREAAKGKAAEQAASAFKAGSRYVEELKTIRKESSELFEQCKNGGITVPQAKREIHRAEYAERIEAAKNAPKTAHWDTHGIILADPPWRHEFIASPSRRNENHYQTATLEEIASHRPESAAQDSVLFLWATAPLLPEALSVMASWGSSIELAQFGISERSAWGFGFAASMNSCLWGPRQPGDSPRTGAPLEYIQRVARRAQRKTRVRL